MGQQGLFQEIAADSRAAAKITHLEAPAAGKPDVIAFACDEQGACADDDHGSVIVAERTLQ
ncbi:hypothetical protein, partial [Stenotrophomonas maltophilia]|uniref:hypothetical protein n=1 Tax=Stenotrophomonas maltophilia TaxID=40324 RepID=UPI0013DC392D